MVIFAAHWCPHCQREIPIVQAWVDAGGVPKDVDLISVSTAIDPTQPNYPPEAWFEREGWTLPIIVDPTNTVAAAYGLASYPYFVILDGAGNVFGRLSGEIPVADLERILAAVPRS
jgi:thiol-disulfide isomerase/thioredoxin